MDEQALQAAAPLTNPRPPSRVAPWLGAALQRTGWRWWPTSAEAVEDAIGIIADVGRDGAAVEIRWRHPQLTASVANNLVLFLAGSRMRDGLGWPGVVWLDARHGRRAAEIDRGTQSVIAALVAERRARPVNSIGGAIRIKTAKSILLRSRSTARPSLGRHLVAEAVAS